MKKTLWVLIANSSEAKIYRAENTKKLTEIALLDHPESRLLSREIVSDSPGRAFESANGMTRHALEPATTPQQYEFIVFAKTISNYLEHARSTGKFHALYLAAGPSFLGLLRQSLSTPTQQIIAGEVDKDLTKATPTDISNYFQFSFI